MNLIPVLAKADCLTKSEVKKKKEKIMKASIAQSEIEFTRLFLIPIVRS